MRKGVKLGIGAGVIVSAIAISVILAATRSDTALAVRIEPAARRDLVAEVNGNGFIRPHRRVDVQSDIMGRIIELRVKEGDQVSTGDVLLRIDPTQYEAAVERARAAVSEARSREAQANANLIQSQRALERLRLLRAQGEDLVSAQQIEETETQVAVNEQLAEASRYGVAQAEAMLGEERDRLAKTVIRAPMDGVITRLNVDEGETAIVGTMNNAGSLLLTVADLSTMEAVIRVDETDMPQISLGDSALVRIDAFTRQSFTGRVTEISHSSVRPPESQQATSQQQAVDYEIVITLDDPPQGLRSDLSASADIVTDRRSGVLSVPIIALTVRDRSSIEALPQEDPAAAQAAAAAADPRDRDLEGVFVVREGKARFVPVTVGVAGREHFEVLAGITEGDSVVAGPYEAIRSLQEGQAVRAMAADTTVRAAATATANGGAP